LREKVSTLLTSDGYFSWADGGRDGREGRMEKARRFADDMVGSRKETTWRLNGGSSLEDETKRRHLALCDESGFCGL
jgi:hypothetical protein